MSDHGEQAGEHGLIGKSTFYEGSARIPMMFAGDLIEFGRVVNRPVSILDVGPTLCEIAGADTPPRQDGVSLRPLFVAQNDAEAERMVISEFIYQVDGNIVHARMLRQGNFGLDRTDLLQASSTIGLKTTQKRIRSIDIIASNSQKRRRSVVFGLQGADSRPE
ncbi:sulfatase/phosphatase domain-containing protein [Paenibacillus sp. FSL H8-0034]|uniref:sulfatase/phosphatase domain-containing protein n=1 Tax=Paenibacillus sp. FSL H8-0034 TaxID=2954671 RepID=UPI0030F82D1F